MQNVQLTTKQQRTTIGFSRYEIYVNKKNKKRGRGHRIRTTISNTSKTKTKGRTNGERSKETERKELAVFAVAIPHVPTSARRTNRTCFLSTTPSVASSEVLEKIQQVTGK
ncbi:hypothetical protein, unlikely [Trypanosoma brucei gambiense DAL972]|uniref:Uncharacterized protein n=1 Tax=Trypanosoma brucei gambiense (strain MHOM/CI/86/DAL972) TaxID=679716 RepID=C9ZYY6_TRYB9|nr:hypothetical protein, unlikely [Trypanosoma brucei gambiense DAL972]CBH14635.1 hypothetical protein, unlikely [Trypanosoma brucei gambiense DAL972]|eukprot:XP_011776901.1 hypothetical protein, unlikely [Trypanosoma brucei gambiense DAL972]